MAEIQCDYCKGQGYIHRVFYGGARGGNGDYTCPKCNGSGVLAQPAPTDTANADGAVTGDDVPAGTMVDVPPSESELAWWNMTQEMNDDLAAQFSDEDDPRDAELTRQRERADAAERERDELQAAVNAAVAGVDTLAPLEALTRLLELRRRAGGS